MPFTYDDFDLRDVKTYPLKSRKSKAHVEDFARPAGGALSIAAFVEGLPNILAAADFKAIVAAIRQAARADDGVVWGLGAHVIKVKVPSARLVLSRDSKTSGPRWRNRR